jgi:hypothetical protein
MNKQQKMLMSAERAINRLVKLSKQISNDVLADWMIQGDKLGNCDAGNLWFVATWLSDSLRTRWCYSRVRTLQATSGVRRLRQR